MRRTLQSQPRIEVVDALRGFAVMAIILLHNIEHFNLYNFPDSPSGFLEILDKGIWDTLFFLFAGKAYAIFALLFGFSFFIQFDNQTRKGKDFRWRFLWRLTLLLCLGFFNAVFFPGEILVLYALLGVVLIPVCQLSNRFVLAIALILMLQPMEWGKWIYAIAHPSYVAAEEQWAIHARQLYPCLEQADFWNMVRANLWDGQLFSLLWAWSYGRFFQTASLFMLGMWLGRTRKFADLEHNTRFWQRTLLIGVACFIPLYLLAGQLPDWIGRLEEFRPMNTIVTSLRNFSFMSVWVSLFVILWQKARFYTCLKILIPYGKMSLTNYITQSMVGSFIYFGYGLALFDDLCTTYSFMVGVSLFILQLGFCHWWLRRYKQGPFEKLWRKATWILS